LEPTLVTSDPRAVVRFLHDVIQLSDAEIAEGIGVQAAITVRRWRSEEAGGAPRRLNGVDDLRAIVGMLVNSRLLYAEEVGRFLRSRNEHLGYRRPLKLLADGQFERVMDAAEQLLLQLARRRQDELDESSAALEGAGKLPAGMTRVPSGDGIAVCPRCGKSTPE
jgi:hypothetical protein